MIIVLCLKDFNNKEQTYNGSSETRVSTYPFSGTVNITNTKKTTLRYCYHMHLLHNLYFPVSKKIQKKKIPKEYSETLIRRTDITIVKGKGTQRQTKVDILLHWKLNIEHLKPPITNGVKLICFRKMNSSCSTSGTRRVTLVMNLWQVVYEERAWLWLWQIEDIRGHIPIIFLNLFDGWYFIFVKGPQWPQSTDMHTLRRYMHLWFHLYCSYSIKCLFL